VALDHAEQLAHARLNKNDEDPDALFALTLASGLQADYVALIEKRNLASLHYTKEASTWAQQLLAVCSNCYDAQLQLTAQHGHYLAPFARICCRRA
jgi:hypothetical protein